MSTKSLRFLFVLVSLFSACQQSSLESVSAPEAETTTKRAEQSGGTPTLAAKGVPAPSVATVSPPANLPTADTPVVPLGDPGAEPSASADLGALAGPTVTLNPSTENTPDTLSFSPKLLNSTSDVYILLDASGSMNSPYADTSRSKFSVAKDAVTTILDQLSAASGASTELARNIGVIGFGSQSSLDANNCEDANEWYQLGELNPNELRGKLNQHKAQGQSPIGKAIKLALEHFPTGSSADRVLVLLADGADTCNNLCSYAQELSQIPTGTSKKPIIQVVGFDVSSEDQAQLECIAKATDGKFFLARNENELRTSLDEAINSTVPYNLKLNIQAGTEPLPTTVSVLKAGTDQLVLKQQSFGSKLLKLAPGSYDILVEYTESPEGKLPSKLIKGVEVLQDTKVEQTVSFELGSLALSAIADDTRLVAAKYEIKKAGTAETVSTIESPGERKTFFLSPGSYDIVAKQLAAGPEEFVLTESNLSLQAGSSVDKVFRFQRGTVSLRGITTQKQTIPFLFRAYKAGETQQTIAVGAFPAEGGSFNLAPGSYDILVIGQDPESPAQARTKLANVTVSSQSTTELEAVFEMSSLLLRAQDSKNQPISAHFTLREHNGPEVIAQIDYLKNSKNPIKLPLPPGAYDIVAELIESSLDPKPLVPLTNVQVTTAKPTELSATFVLGNLRLMGRNSKEKPFKTKFTVYMAGKDELIFSSEPTSTWLQLTLAPGFYDIKAENVENVKNDSPVDHHVWLRDLEVKDAQTISHEAIFTTGKIRLIGRGPNGKIIPCEFKIFEYGADRELIHGTTGDDWQAFDINPGKYYLEVGYHDPEQAVILKKWINISVDENQILEQVLRF